MWTVTLIIIYWVTNQEPMIRYVPMPDTASCMANVQHLMETAQYADDMHYAAGCQLEPAGWPA